jgi:hypothetical protein
MMPLSTDNRLSPLSQLRCNRGIAVGIFFLVLAAYIVTYNGAFKSNDERALFSGIDSFVKRGAFTTNQIYWDYTHVGVFTTAGDMVPNYEPAQMVAAIPLYLWGRALGPGVQGVMFFGAVIMAASASLIYLCLLELGCDRHGSILGALVFAFATAAWPYSRSFFREPLTILAYLLAFYGLFRFRDCTSHIAQRTSYITPLPWLALSGFALGLALTTKQIGVAIVPSLLLLMTVYELRDPATGVSGFEPLGGLFRDRRRPAEASIPGLRAWLKARWRPTDAAWRAVWAGHARAALAFVVPLAIMLLLNRWYTATTLGGVETFARDVVDYTTNPQLSSSAPERMLRAAVGLTISPYKGLFWFSPALLLGLIGAVPFIRRRPWEGLALVAAAAIHLLGYSRYNYWSGGVTWGSRYMLQIVPFLILLAAPVWDWIAECRMQNAECESANRKSQIAFHVRRLTFDVSRLMFDVSRTTQYAIRLLVWLLIALSLLIQLLGIAVDYRTFEVKWLLDNAAVWGGIGQAIEGLFMQPAESPVVGHLRLLLSGTQPLDFAWVQLRPEGKWAFVPAGLLLSLFLCGLAAAAFVWIWRRPARAGRAGGLLAVATLVICSGLLLIYRQGDARFDPYNVDRFLKPMLATLDKPLCSAAAPCNDVLLVPDPTLTDYFLNYLAAPLVWYSVEPQPVDERLMAQLLARYGRVWLVRDRNAQTDDTEGRRAWERYLTEHAYKLGEQRFGDWARLLSFSAAGRPAEIVAPRQALGEMILAEARLGLEQRSGAVVTQPMSDGKVLAQSGDTLQVALRWQATAPPAGNYTVFLQLLDAGSQVKAQVDRWPGDGFYPTAGLSTGQVITDNLALPLEVSPGEYRLIAGMYRGNMEGYPRLSGPQGNFVLISQVVVR